MSLFGLGQHFRRRNRKTTLQENPISSGHSKGGRGGCNTTSDFSLGTRCSSAGQADQDTIVAMSLKELNLSGETNENDVVPDAAEYDIPFGPETNDVALNKTEKELDCLRREMAEIKERLVEIEKKED